MHEGNYSAHELVHGVYLVQELLQKVAMSGNNDDKIFKKYPKLARKFAKAEDVLAELYQACGSIKEW